MPTDNCLASFEKSGDSGFIPSVPLIDFSILAKLTNYFDCCSITGILDSVTSPTLCFFFKVNLGVLSPLYFYIYIYTYIRTNLSVSDKKMPAGIKMAE